MEKSPALKQILAVMNFFFYVMFGGSDISLLLRHLRLFWRTSVSWSPPLNILYQFALHDLQFLGKVTSFRSVVNPRGNNRNHSSFLLRDVTTAQLKRGGTIFSMTSSCLGAGCGTDLQLPSDITAHPLSPPLEQALGRANI